MFGSKRSNPAQAAKRWQAAKARTEGMGKKRAPAACFFSIGIPHHTGIHSSSLDRLLFAADEARKTNAVSMHACPASLDD